MADAAQVNAVGDDATASDDNFSALTNLLQPREACGGEGQRERRRVGGSSVTPLPSQAWPGRISSTKPASILRIEGQQDVSRALVAHNSNDGKPADASETNYVAIDALPR